MPKRILEGNVVSNKMDKTVTVLVERRYLHPVYRKYVRHSSKFVAHDEGNLCQENDRVQIEECAPLSKRKSWQVISGEAGVVNKTFFDGGKIPLDGQTSVKAGAKKDASKKAAPKKETAKKTDKKDSK